jgi:hypothetical protein
MKITALALSTLFVLSVPCGAQSAEAQAPKDVWEALKGGDFWLKFRYRFEGVDQDPFTKDAAASTLRTVLGYESLPFHGVRGLVEFEDVSQIGDDRYNSTTNGRVNYPVVADPEGTELNQAYLAYMAECGADTRFGRQRIKLDNDRFIGNVGWRQNEQTFDAVTAKAPLGEGGDVFLGFLDNVNTINGESAPGGGNAPMQSWLANVSHDVGSLGSVAAYWYYLDYTRMGNYGLSTSTVGARLTGSRSVGEDVDVMYTGEYAHQTDAGDNPNSVSEGYYHLQLGANVSAIEVQFGYEVLEGSGQPGEVFTTPLATLHAFNGWADKFLTPSMPNTGLEDGYVSVGCKLGDVKLKAVYHDFQSQDTSTEYGSEIDLLATAPVNEHVSWGVKYANYQKDKFATDTEKFWIWLSVVP